MLARTCSGYFAQRQATSAVAVYSKIGNRSIWWLQTALAWKLCKVWIRSPTSELTSRSMTGRLPVQSNLNSTRGCEMLFPISWELSQKAGSNYANINPKDGWVATKACIGRFDSTCAFVALKCLVAAAWQEDAYLWCRWFLPLQGPVIHDMLQQ